MDFVDEAEEYKQAYTACRKKLPEGSPTVVASCAETSVLKKILEEKLKELG